MNDPDPATIHATQCAFPRCECPGETPACPDYEETSDAAWYSRAAGGPDLRTGQDW